MTPIRRSTWMPRLLTAAAGTVLALSLTACGGSGGDKPAEDQKSDAAKTTNWASDDGMKIDKKGNGIVPASSIEADLVDLFENKLDWKVKEAKCDSDMELREWYGFKSCQVTVKDKDAYKGRKKYFGTVKIVDHKDQMIKYELMFPGIDKEDFDFKD